MQVVLTPLQFKRLQANPLDADTVFSTTADRTAYLASPRRYAGMVVCDVQEEKLYYLNAARDTWLPLFQTRVYTYTSNQQMLATHAEGIVRMDSASAVNFTIPADLPVPIGTLVVVSQNGAGQVTLVAGSGVTIITPETLKLRKQYGKVSLMLTSANYWEVEGNLEIAP